MLTKTENDSFTRLGPGTRAGEMLRRYWWPIAFSDEVKGARPKKVRLLGEDFVIFRDGNSRLGMLDLQCAHRRASLQHGRVEKEGIRCCYHGWLWAADGRCLEQPCEAPDNTYKDRVFMASYSVQDAAGLVFAYIGPKPAPLLPKYDLLVHESGTRYVWGFTDHCNWLQTIENGADMSHLNWLHAGPYPSYATKRSEVDCQRREYGLQFFIRIPDLPSVNNVSLIFPAFRRFASARTDQGAGRQNMLIHTPQDDHTTLSFWITLAPSTDGKLVHKTETPPEQAHRGPWIPTERGVYPEGDADWWGVESVMQDRMAIESQGEIFDRTREHLAPTDRGVVMYRKLLKEAIDAVAQGKDPMNVVRDPAQNRVVEVGAHMHTMVPPLVMDIATSAA